MENIKMNKAIVDGLKSSRIEDQLSAIEQIRVDGTVHYLSVLADLFVDSKNEDVREKISSVFQDVKDSNAGSAIAEILLGTSNNELRIMLLASCWAARIDYSSFIVDFIRLAVDYDYLVAFEVLTVVENFETIPTPEKISEALAILDGAIVDEVTPKAEIIREISVVVSNL